MNNMTFMLHSWENVLRFMETTKSTVSRDLQKDIQKTIDIMQKHTILNPSDFEKYDQVQSELSGEIRPWGRCERIVRNDSKTDGE